MVMINLNPDRPQASEARPELRVRIEMPYSEVCCHMKVAGKLMWVEDVGNGMAQLYDVAGCKFSFPITWGEAGVYQLFTKINVS